MPQIFSIKFSEQNFIWTLIFFVWFCFCSLAWMITHLIIKISILPETRLRPSISRELLNYYSFFIWMLELESWKKNISTQFFFCYTQFMYEFAGSLEIECWKLNWIQKRFAFGEGENDETDRTSYIVLSLALVYASAFVITFFIQICVFQNCI